MSELLYTVICDDCKSEFALGVIRTATASQALTTFYCPRCGSINTGTKPEESVLKDDSATLVVGSMTAADLRAARDKVAM